MCSLGVGAWLRCVSTREADVRNVSGDFLGEPLASDVFALEQTMGEVSGYAFSTVREADWH
jgi:hypothetical protein